MTRETTEKLLIQADKEQAHISTEESIEDSSEVTVSGFALPFGERSRNGNRYTEKSIRDNAEDFIGKPVLWNHNRDTPAIGHVSDVSVTSEGLDYEVNLDTEDDLGAKVARKIERGDISSVSIGARVRDSETERGSVDVVGWNELTVCNIPGFPETTTQIDGEEYVTESEYFEAKHGDKDDGDDRDEDRDVGEPFAGYDDFQSCVNDNQDKDDAEAYCAAIKRRVENYYEQNQPHRVGREVFGQVYDDEGETRDLASVPEPTGIEDPCQDGYTMVGTKQQDGRTVPNCVPNESLAQATEQIVEEVDFTPTEEAVNNAEDALRMREEHPDTAGECGGPDGTGWLRAQQIVDDRLGPVSVKKMSQYRRHEDNAPVDDDKEPHEDCGHVMWKAWGGDAGVSWAESLVDEMEERCEALINKEAGDKPTMDESATNDLEEQLDGLTERDLFDLIASHYEGLGVEDVAALYEDQDFTGYKIRELASFLAEGLGLSTEEVLEALEDLAEMGDEERQGGDMDDEEPMDDEDTADNADADDDAGEENQEESRSRDELRAKIDSLEERVQELTEDDGDDDDNGVEETQDKEGEGDEEEQAPRGTPHGRAGQDNNESAEESTSYSDLVNSAKNSST